MKLDGLDKLSRELEQASKALAELDGELGSVSFDPHDPASIDRAIKEVAKLVDSRVEGYESNSIVAPMIEEMKERYREAILEKAATARLQGSDSDE